MPLSMLWRRLMLEPEETRRALVVPALVWEAPPATSRDSGTWRLTGSEVVPEARLPGESLVLMVEKATAQASTFPAGVTLGRAESNDLVIEDATVSRFHAWVHHDVREGSWLVVDAESRTGTWVNGQKLLPRQRRALVDGDELRLGDAVLRFLLADSLLAYVRDRSG